MKSIIKKSIMPVRIQSQEEKFSNQSSTKYEAMSSTKVRSGHNICCLCSFLIELRSCRVTHENCYKSSFFFNLV